MLKILKNNNANLSTSSLIDNLFLWTSGNFSFLLLASLKYISNSANKTPILSSYFCKDKTEAKEWTSFSLPQPTKETTNNNRNTKYAIQTSRNYQKKKYMFSILRRDIHKTFEINFIILLTLHSKNKTKTILIFNKHNGQKGLLPLPFDIPILNIKTR